MEKSPSQILKIREMMQRVVIKDEGGNAIGEDWAFSLDDPSITQFLEHIGRALLFEEIDQQFFEADFEWLLSPPIPAEIYQFAIAHYPKRKILDVLAYSVSPEINRVHSIMLQFYGSVVFLLRYKKKS